MHYSHYMHDTHNMHYMHDTPQHERFYQYGTTLRDQFY